MSKKEAVQAEGSPSPLTITIIIVILSILGGLAYVFFMGKAPALGASATKKTTDLDADGKPINAAGYLINADGSLMTDAAGEPILGAGVAGPTGGGGVVDAIAARVDQVKSALSGGSRQDTIDTNGSYFPLAQVTGSALHTPNPYVKDLQQYLIKFGGATLDIDGAFGAETEAAALKTLGTKTITREQYNSTIAPPLGKSAV